jgi:integrase
VIRLLPAGWQTPQQISNQKKKKRKSSEYTVKNRNRFILVEEGDNISEVIYRVGQEYLKKVNENTKNEKRIGKACLLVKALYFIYLTGSRVNEVFIKEPKLTYFKEKIKTEKGIKEIEFVKVERVLEKHFLNRKENIHQDIIQIIPANYGYEADMWSYIFDHFIYGKEYTLDLSGIAKPGTKKENLRIILRRLMVQNFKLKQKNPLTGEIVEEGITPHALRHWRAFNLRVEKGWEEIEVTRTLGWSSPKMIYYYIDILQGVQEKELLKELIKVALNISDEEFTPLS